MKKLAFSALFFSAIAWLWIGHIIAADGYLINSSGVTTTSSSGGAAPAGLVITNNNVNNVVLWTNNGCSLQVNMTSGVWTFTNYAGADLGNAFTTNGTLRLGPGTVISVNDMIFTRGAATSLRAGSSSVSVIGQIGVGNSGASNPEIALRSVATGGELNNTSAGVLTNLSVKTLTSTNHVIGGTGGPTWSSGSGSPESAVTAPVGSLYSRTDGGAATSLYVKESGSGNTGWTAK